MIAEMEMPMNINNSIRWLKPILRSELADGVKARYRCDTPSRRDMFIDNLSSGAPS